MPARRSAWSGGRAVSLSLLRRAGGGVGTRSPRVYETPRLVDDEQCQAPHGHARARPPGTAPPTGAYCSGALPAGIRQPTAAHELWQKNGHEGDVVGAESGGGDAAGGAGGRRRRQGGRQGRGAQPGRARACRAPPSCSDDARLAHGHETRAWCPCASAEAWRLRLGAARGSLRTPALLTVAAHVAACLVCFM